MNDKELFTRISEVENRLNITIPKVYKDFLLKCLIERRFLFQI